MQRIFAHRIIYDGVVYDNHVIELDDRGNVSLFPFRGEIHSTRFISGTVEVTIDRESGCLRATSTGEKFD